MSAQDRFLRSRGAGAFDSSVSSVGSMLVTLAALAVAACGDPLVLPQTRPLTPADSGVAFGLALDGDECEMDFDCKSGHCNNDTCCASGECCRETTDCKSAKKAEAVCDQPATCQGHRPVVVCAENSRCEERDPKDDDSACTTDLEANSCGTYASVYCNGTARQTAPLCPESCQDDSECDEGTHCSDNKCISDLGDSAVCNDDGDCTSGHCSHGVCCKSGTCCSTVADCDSDEFRKASACTTPGMCQGMRGVPACEQHQCTMAMIPDDTGCDLAVTANECSGGAPVKCMGGREQLAPPQCASGTCFQYYDCARSAFCQQGRCVPDNANGETCNSPDMCQSGHCEEGKCCTYDCCDPNRCSGAPCDDMVKCPS